MLEVGTITFISERERRKIFRCNLIDFGYKNQNMFSEVYAYDSNENQMFFLYCFSIAILPFPISD